jgi:hypothetical protein
MLYNILQIEPGQNDNSVYLRGVVRVREVTPAVDLPPLKSGSVRFPGLSI